MATGAREAGPGFLGARRSGEGIELRVWAPERRAIEVDLLDAGARPLARLPLARDGGGTFSLATALPGAALYRYRVDGEGPYPDPCSRGQPLGVHGPSELPSEATGEGYAWADAGWGGVPLDRLVIYELHVGAFTPAGTFEAIIPRLPALRRLGVTALELMPVAAFPGRRNWGYDGVALFAPHAGYGGRRGLKRLVDAAHRAGLAVLLDVVYNHLGPDGNYLRAFTPRYFTARHQTPWGDAVDFDEPGVRAFFAANAAMWIGELHLDGLRLDATHAIADPADRDPARPSALAQIAAAARAAATARTVVIIAEDDRNERRLLGPLGEGGRGLDAVWADDFHHVARSLLCGDSDGYFEDYHGSAGELCATLEGGWLYRGAPSRHRGGAPRGTSPEGIALPRFVHCLQNHDQVGNRALGDRLHAALSLERLRAATAVLLLAPETPLLFMGQEFAASAPFLYFTDHEGALGAAVREGRRAEFARFVAFSREAVPDPQAEETFARSRLDWEERSRPGHAGLLALHEALLALRSTHPALRSGAPADVTARPLGPRALVLERRCGREALTLIANLGDDPLVVPLADAAAPLLSTEERRFDGAGTARVEAKTPEEPARAVLPGAGALVLPGRAAAAPR